MLKRNQAGALDPLALPLMIAVLVLIGVSVFGIWSYTQYTDINNNLDTKVEEGVTALRSQIEGEVEIEFLEREKEPLRTYKAPAALGSIEVDYPKTWSVYVEESSGSGTELDAFFHPGFVRADNEFLDALRVQLQDNQYASVLDDYDNQVENGELKASVISVAGVRGVRLDGLIDRDVTGSLVLLPIRDKTILIWTESNEFLNDFNNRILPNFTFIP